MLAQAGDAMAITSLAANTQTTGRAPGPPAGGLPDGDRDVVAARQHVADRLEELVPFAAEHGVRLVLEPLYPMYAAGRALLSTLGQAPDPAAPYPAAVGVAVGHLPRVVGAAAACADRQGGYTGDIEVEIFDQEIWDNPGDELLETVRTRYASLVLLWAG